MSSQTREPNRPRPAATRRRPRLRELGHSVGVLPTGPLNTLVDVPGVDVGQVTLVQDLPNGSAVRTGVTAILPHAGNLYTEKVLGACHVINGYGKATGLSQLTELGTVEAPILITNTLAVGAVWEGGMRHVLTHNPGVGLSDTVNVIVGECFDGYLNDTRGLHVTFEHALAAIAAATHDEIGEGAVGAGTGTTCLGFKAGVGTASRATLASPTWLLGALVVTNYGRREDLHLLVGSDIDAGEPTDEDETVPATGAEGGSVIVVLATDTPLSERQLRRLAARAAFGLARAGAIAANSSGDFVIAFSTAHHVSARSHQPYEDFRFLRDDSPQMRELFQAAAEATREAVLNSLCTADAMTGRNGHHVEAFPHRLLGAACRP